MGGYLANCSAPQTSKEFTPITSLFLLENIHCGCSLESSRRDDSNEHPPCMFLCRNKKVRDVFVRKIAPLSG